MAGRPPAAVIVAADADGIAAAVAALAAGSIVALPTETVYGLAADATDADAVAKIFTAKGRPGFNPLIVHVADLDAAGALVDINATARALAARFWPGPLTLVLAARTGNGIAPAVAAGLPTLAIRIHAHPVMQAVLRGVGRPLAAPSANASGSISPTTAAHVAASLGDRAPVIVDGGPTPGGLESTIVAVAGDRVTLLRPGGIAAAALGVNAAAGAGITAPGQLASHYAPRQPVRLNATDRRNHGRMHTRRVSVRQRRVRGGGVTDPPAIRVDFGIAADGDAAFAGECFKGNHAIFVSRDTGRGGIGDDGRGCCHEQRAERQ